jgi:CheY-like chemotaxis protein
MYIFLSFADCGKKKASVILLQEGVMAKRILVVDDEPDIVKVVVFRLKKEGYDLQIAIDGQQGLELAKTMKPDLILLDITLPKMNGYEVCERIKTDEALKHIPIIFMTASVSAGAFNERFSSTGAQGYVSKPFDFQHLLDEIHKFLN